MNIKQWELVRGESGAKVYIVWDDESGETFRTAFPQRVVQHSPDGYEWGYGGSGAAELALNILDAVIGFDNVIVSKLKFYDTIKNKSHDEMTEYEQDAIEEFLNIGYWNDYWKAYNDAWVLNAVYSYCQDFKWDCIAEMPRKGGIIRFDDVVVWLEKMGVNMTKGKVNEEDVK